MKIIDHFLVDSDSSPYLFINTPNQGTTIAPVFIIIHYTAMENCEQAVKRLTDPVSQASAHLLIGRKGNIVQLAPFNKATWHAGRSRWRNYENLNNHSIGIELDNAGWLNRSMGSYYSWFGKEYPREQVYLYNGKEKRVRKFWHSYSGIQLETTHKVIAALSAAYSIQAILRHSDVSPRRKPDPGPAFPFDSIYSPIQPI
jgi:N-acetylmuramoyl-L-alanine amidase